MTDSLRFRSLASRLKLSANYRAADVLRLTGYEAPETCPVNGDIRVPRVAMAPANGVVK